MTASDLKTPEDWDPAIAQYTDDVVKARFNSAVHITPFIPHSYFTPSIRDTHHISFLPHSYFPYRTIVGYQRQLNPQVNALAPQNVLRAKGTLSPSHKQHHKQFERFKERTGCTYPHVPITPGDIHDSSGRPTVERTAMLETIIESVTTGRLGKEAETVLSISSTL
jgi:hypothetical protein